MFGNDRRTALLGRIEKIRELITSFFRAFTQDSVHHARTVQHRTDSVNKWGATSASPTLKEGCDVS